MTLEPTSYAERVAALVDRLARVTRELQYVDGLNPAQWEAMRYLARANRYSRSPGALADFLGATKGTASQTLIALEAKGYITRTRSVDDRRSVILELTERGIELLKQDPILAIEAAVGSLGDEQGVHLVKGLSRLLHDLQKRHGIKEFGVCSECTLYCVAGHVAYPEDGDHCGKTGERLPSEGKDKICANFRAAE